MGGLEEDVQVHSGFVAFVFVEDAGDDGASTNLKVFVGRPLVLGFVDGGFSVTVDFPLPITSM
jgi:hypothetical protein